MKKTFNCKQSPKHTDLKKEELKKIYKKYHPMENDFSLAVDDEYKKRLEKTLGIKIEE